MISLFIKFFLLYFKQYDIKIIGVTRNGRRPGIGDFTVFSGVNIQMDQILLYFGVSQMKIGTMVSLKNQEK